MSDVSVEIKMMLASSVSPTRAPSMAAFRGWCVPATGTGEAWELLGATGVGGRVPGCVPDHKACVVSLWFVPALARGLRETLEVLIVQYVLQLKHNHAMSVYL